MIDRRTLLTGAVAVFAAACAGDRTDGIAVPATDTGGGQPANSNSAPGATPQGSAAPTTLRAPGAPSIFVTPASTARNQVALTFHTDGDVRIAQRLLDSLAGRAQITCFVVGS